MNFRLYGLVLGLAVAFAAGWAVNGWRLERDHAAEALERSRETLRAMERRDDLARDLAAQNDRSLAKLERAQNDTNRLRACLADGTCGLRGPAVAAGCVNVPEAAGGAGLDLGAGAGSAGAVGRAYIALREGIDRTVAQLAACQDQLRARATP